MFAGKGAELLPGVEDVVGVVVFVGVDAGELLGGSVVLAAAGAGSAVDIPVLLHALSSAVVQRHDTHVA